MDDDLGGVGAVVEAEAEVGVEGEAVAEAVADADADADAELEGGWRLMFVERLRWWWWWEPAVEVVVLPSGVTSFLDDTRDKRFLTAPDLERLCLQSRRSRSRLSSAYIPYLLLIQP